ncbi:5310_t:CDS:1, partial [Acaulospora colombiana]
EATKTNVNGPCWLAISTTILNPYKTNRWRSTLSAPRPSLAIPTVYTRSYGGLNPLDNQFPCRVDICFSQNRRAAQLLCCVAATGE